MNLSRLSASESPDLTHGYAFVEGVRLHYVTQGQGLPVLLIPGWPQTWFTWRFIMSALAANGFQAIAVDPPGTGLSDRPESGYDTGTVARRLQGLMVSLGHSHYQVVGHDVGMWVGYALASDYPQAIRKLALCEAVIPGLAPAPTIFAAPQQNKFLWHFMFNQVPDLPQVLIAGREAAYLTYMFDTWSHRRDRVAVQVYVDAYSAPGALRAGFGYYRAIPETIEQNLQRAKTPLSMPVLAIGAQHATNDAPLLTMQGNASDLRGAVIADCGHFVTEEAPEAFIAHLLPFLLANA
ncbi:alpha/beta hydrolase [Pseudomonas purpurea]|uniref:alpha/beta fold hydrolase n=1 Tax=Pseudomonas purpurea TaxID=3136737 RepID=UPI0032668080